MVVVQRFDAPVTASGNNYRDAEVNAYTRVQKALTVEPLSNVGEGHNDPGSRATEKEKRKKKGERGKKEGQDIVRRETLIRCQGLPQPHHCL